MDRTFNDVGKEHNLSKNRIMQICVQTLFRDLVSQGYIDWNLASHLKVRAIRQRYEQRKNCL